MLCPVIFLVKLICEEEGVLVREREREREVAK
jgi:hypothetical protein